MSTVTENGLETTPTTDMMRRYLLTLVSAFVLGGSLLVMTSCLLSYDGEVVHDHFSEIVKEGDPDWYRDIGGRHATQIQDQDIFYSNIGYSIASASAADIVFLGASFVSYAVDRETLQSSPLLGRLKIYNMAFVGVRSGEFSRRVVNRWRIRAPLWVINADDQFVHFFSDDLSTTQGTEKMPILAVQRSRMRGYLTVVGRNIKWRIEDWIAVIRYSPLSLFGYRNVSNGDIFFTSNAAYLASHNKPLRIARDPNCGTNPTVVSYARQFLNEIGGNVVLILVPHSQACVRQAAELANELNIELIAPPADGLTSWDSGGHLDKRGAENFTSNLAAELVKTKAFKKTFAGKLGGS
jgi:hypothetical protein